ncbi:hypothetical protein TorRG33x02_220950 [Trema orientale]|uniref:Uncharacterized protein n=1 Tax=Trema orientale TaxID=63057 RepID=A0A2P5E9D9_TREOI|nr:hypothetical protein TorRG33x02_220950 [Trema orientale]
MQIHKFPPAILLSSSCLNSHMRLSTKTHEIVAHKKIMTIMKH